MPISNTEKDPFVVKGIELFDKEYLYMNGSHWSGIIFHAYVELSDHLNQRENGVCTSSELHLLHPSIYYAMTHDGEIQQNFKRLARR